MVFDNVALRDFIYARLDKAEMNSEWDSLISTGTQSNLNAEKVRDFEISVPNPEESSLIAAFFAQLDNLITLHQREPRFADTG